MNPLQALRHSWGRHLIAPMLVTLAALVRIWPLQALESTLAWLTFYPAVILAAVYGGRFTGLLATALACIAVMFGWPLLVAHPFIKSQVDFLGMSVFVLNGILISWIAEAMHRANERARKAVQEAEAAAAVSAGKAQFIKAVTDAVPNMIGYWDRDLRLRFANNAYLDWFGKTAESLIGISFVELAGEQLFAMNKPHIDGVLAGQRQRFHRTLNKANGTVGYIVGNYIPDIGADGTVSGFYILANEVTELMETHAQLELAASVFANTVEGIAVTDPQGIILSVNPAFTEITGFTAEEAVGKTPRILKSNRHDHAFYVAMWGEITDKGRWKGDIWNRRKDGEIYLERITISMIRGPDGKPIRYVSVFSDITDLWRKDEYLKHLAFHDALTDLPNRSLLIERLQHRISVAAREKFTIALMFLDLDGFKHVNDHFGHDIGDDLLKIVAQRIRTLVRQSDTVARMGGDEFIIKLNNPLHRDEVTDIANRIIATVNDPIELNGKAIRVGASIGIAMFPDDATTPAELIKHADTAMYAAKSAGKNICLFFEPTMTAPEGSERASA